MIHLSLIIPVYNEDARLARGLMQILSYVAKQNYRWEIIVVDDGSATPVSTLVGKKKRGVSIIRLEKNQGKGAAIAAGVRRAKGRYIVFSDIDLSTPIRTLKPMLLQLSSADIVIASRRHKKSRIIAHQPAVREFAGRLFTALSNLLCDTGVSDATCGFKGFRRDVAKRLFSLSQIKRWVFDTEILFLARNYGYSVMEIPVSWRNAKGSKVRFVDAISSLIDLVRIRVYDARGQYT